MAPVRRIRAVSLPRRPGRRGPGRSGAAGVALAPGRSSWDGPEPDRYSLPFLLAPPDLWVMHSSSGRGGLGERSASRLTDVGGGARVAELSRSRVGLFLVDAFLHRLGSRLD